MRGQNQQLAQGGLPFAYRQTSYPPDNFPEARNAKGSLVAESVGLSITFDGGKLSEYCGVFRYHVADPRRRKVRRQLTKNACQSRGACNLGILDAHGRPKRSQSLPDIIDCVRYLVSASLHFAVLSNQPSEGCVLIGSIHGACFR